MYIANHNRETNIENVLDIVSRYNFATLYTVVSGKHVAVHVPVLVKLLENKFYLHGHVAKQNPISEAIRTNANALISFMGPHCYVSSGWYEKESVPTWNYAAVQFSGALNVLSEDEMHESLSSLIQHQESGRDNPVSMQKITPAVVNGLKHGITGFSMLTDNFEASFKLSQNKSTSDKKNIIHHLEQLADEGSREIAKMMRHII